MTGEDAISRIKARFDKWALDDEDMKAIKTLIPELAESEDERIRKELVAVLEDLILPDDQRRRFLDYIEKHKEQKAAEFTYHETNESLKDAVTHQMEDDGDIDDFVRKGIDDVVLKYAKLGAKWQKEQKPAEWSEKEEKRIQRIYDFLWKNRKGDTDTIYQIEKDADWLKSLRPDSYKNCNSRWKPSEEQMAMLLAVINEPNNAMAESCQLALKSFYEHFKKLM